MNWQAKQTTAYWLRSALAWLVAILMFFPIFWTVLTSFKTELQAIAIPPLLFFEPTLENYEIVQQRSDYLRYALNSVYTSFGATALALVIAIPAAYSLAFFPTKRSKDLLLWMLSTKMLPAVGVLVPIYVLFRDLALLDTIVGLIMVFTLINLPIVVWMLYSSLKKYPKKYLRRCVWMAPAFGTRFAMW